MTTPVTSNSTSQYSRHIMWACMALLLTTDSDIFSNEHVPYVFYLVKFLVFFGLFEIGDSTLKLSEQENFKKHQPWLLTVAGIAAIALIFGVMYYRFA